MKDKILEAVQISKTYGEGESAVQALKASDLTIWKGEFASIIGSSGSGKSTLLKILGGLLPPTAGNVLLDGQDLYAMNAEQLAQVRRQKIGFIFQDYFLEHQYTVYQNIEIALMIAGIPATEREERIGAVLDTVGLSHKKAARTGNLSGGEKQRVCIARSIVTQPELLFADEPCGNLDYENGQSIMRLLRTQAEQGKTVVLVTHNLEDAHLTDEIITLQDGKIIQHET